jgi:hypothetical protein
MLPVYQSIIVVNLSDLLVLSDSVISPDVVLDIETEKGTVPVKIV